MDIFQYISHYFTVCKIIRIPWFLRQETIHALVFQWQRTPIKLRHLKLWSLWFHDVERDGLQLGFQLASVLMSPTDVCFVPLIFWPPEYFSSNFIVTCRLWGSNILSFIDPGASMQEHTSKCSTLELQQRRVNGTPLIEKCACILANQHASAK